MVSCPPARGRRDRSSPAGRRRRNSRGERAPAPARCPSSVFQAWLSSGAGPAAAARPRRQQERELRIIGLGVGLGDPRALVFEKALERFGLGLADCGQILDRLGLLGLGAALQLRFQIGSVLRSPLADPIDDVEGWRAVRERLVELIEGGLFPDRAERPQRLGAAPRLGPGRGDQDDLLMQARRAGAVERETAEQDDARLSAGADATRRARGRRRSPGSGNATDSRRTSRCSRWS